MLEENLATIESRLGLSIPHGGTPLSTSPPSSPPPPPPWAAASNSTASSSLPIHKQADHGTISCGQCNVTFTGTYRRGNLARHVRQKHTEAKAGPYACAADGCYRVFARQDARLKHARKQHPGLYPEAVHRRNEYGKESHTVHSCDSGTAVFPPTLYAQSRPILIPIPANNTRQNRSGIATSTVEIGSPPSSHFSDRGPWSQPSTGVGRSFTIDTIGSSSTASSLDFSVGQWLPPQQQPPRCDGCVVRTTQETSRCDADAFLCPFEVEELPRAARIVFATLNGKLDSEDYSRLCDTTFRRWEALLQHLRNKQ